MTTFPNSPRVLKGGLVLIDPETSKVLRIISLQYNSDSLQRTLQVQATSGEGADRFLFRCVVDAPPEGPNYDEILDFSRTEYDRIDLRPIDAVRGRDASQRFCFIGQENFTRAGQLRYEATADGDFLVSGNADRDLAADFAFVVRTDGAQERADVARVAAAKRGLEADRGLEEARPSQP